jgi:predicted enzyme related to lactoylglutathione lyase
VEELGGTTCSGKEKAGDHGVWIYFKDVEGNRFGVYELVTAEGGH